MLRVILFTSLSILGTAAMAIEKPQYEVIEKIGDLEVRKYQPHNVARTRVTGSFKDIANQGFRRLAGYIFGGNNDNKAIAMTAPVGQMPADSTGGGDYWMTFTMPAEHQFDELPLPNDNRVELVQVPEQIVVVLAYKGGWDEKRYRKHEAALLQTLQENTKWVAVGAPVWARYDHPMTLWFMRRNEVAIVVAPRPDTVPPSDKSSTI